MKNSKSEYLNNKQYQNSKKIKQFEYLNLFRISNLGFRISQLGVSLIELIIYMALFSVLLLMLLQMFTTILNAQLESQATSSVTVDGLFIENRFAYDILRASSIATPSTYGASGSTLHITGTSLDNTYTINNGNLQLTNNLTSTIDNINSVDTSISNLTFTKIGTSSGKSTVQIKFTLTSNVTKRSGAEVKTYQTTIGRR